MSLSLDYLAKLGWTCQIVEKWNAFAKVRQDCFGFGDILAIHRRQGIALVQTTTWGNFNARKEKIGATIYHLQWKEAGGKILLHGWGDKGLREEEL